MISEDGTKLVLVGSHRIRTWCALTGQTIGQVEHGVDRNTERFFPIFDGSTVWIPSKRSSIHWGWDLDNLMSLPLDSCDIPSKHRFALIVDWWSWWCERDNSWIEHSGSLTVKDIASGTALFQPPARFARPIKAGWDGRYLVAAYETGEVLILDFSHTITQ